ncbi:MAG TPA: alkaline phosphatase family protein [Pseudonocardiaceae bacterium]|nr:alkaline phosphatase family protein [Pseudonocardiaceae bacterium]
MDLNLNRRQFIAGAAATTVAGALGASTLAGSPSDASPAPSITTSTHLPLPADSGIEHIVVVMMENRSFDHYLGWLPGADGRQAGLRYPDANGDYHETRHLTAFNGCGHLDPDHSYQGGRTQLDNGACDGFLRATPDDFAIGYYTQDDLSFYGRAARDWTTCDRYFAAMMGPTFPNRLFQHAAQSDRITNTTDITTIPTIWDRLSAAGVPARYYFNDLPVTALWGTRYLGITETFAQFRIDAAAGLLPAVSFVDPVFLGEATGMSGDDHPLADIRVGQHFLNTVYEAVVSSPDWDKTVLIINYDEWGGFFEHVVPDLAPDPRPDLGTGLRGFRVPCLVFSPLARRHTIARRTYDHTSILKMIEWRYGLQPLTVRDAAANNIAEVLDFTRPPDLDAPRYDVPAVIPCACTATSTHAPDAIHHGEDWPPLRDLADQVGFTLS